MKIGLDLRCLPGDGSEGAGVAHAARALCYELVKDGSIKWMAYLPKGSTFEAGSSVTKIALTDASGKSLRSALAKTPCDLLFAPSGAIPLGLKAPAVPWVHDLTIFDHPEWFPQGFFKRQLTTRMFLRGIRRAPVVFAVSEYTKSAIAKHAGIGLEKILVTYEGGDACQGGRSKAQDSRWDIIGRHRIRSPFALALGTVEPRKNLAMLIRAWAQSAKLGGKVPDLVVAGQWGWRYEDVERQIDSLEPALKKQFHRIDKFSDHEKRALLKNAATVCVPSLDEGFGLVALEALQAGTPLIASDRGALPEVVGQAGLLLDPGDEKSWAQAIHLAANPQRPKVLNSVGLGAIKQAFKKVDLKNDLFRPVAIRSDEDVPMQEWVKNFSWQKSADVVLGTLKTLL